MSKPRILILGGVGFIGRNLAHYIIENDLASKVRIVDKVLPATAYLLPAQKAAFEKCEFKQGNLVNPSQLAQYFTDDAGAFDYVFNLAAETKYSQTEEVYNERIFQLSVNCAKEAAKQNVKMFVEVSTAQIYEEGKKPSDEERKLKPWTSVAKYKLKAEEEIKKIPNLNYVIVRPAVVYGPSDLSGITPRIIIAAVYKHMKEEMKFLWTKELRVNTVHVRDVCRALLLLAEKGKVGEVYNLSDKGDTDQETIAAVLREIFGITTGYQGTIVSNFAKLNLASVTEEINDTHLQPWSEMCKTAGITNTPLTPYLDQELLYNNSLSIDGSKIEKLGFTYNHPKITKELVVEVIKSFQEARVWPPMELK